METAQGWLRRLTALPAILECTAWVQVDSIFTGLLCLSVFKDEKQFFVKGSVHAKNEKKKKHLVLIAVIMLFVCRQHQAVWAVQPWVLLHRGVCLSCPW